MSKSYVDFYEDYQKSVEEKKEKGKEVQNALRTGGWESAFEKLKRLMYEYGYQLSNGEEPKELLNQELLDKVGTKGFRNDALINTLIEMDNEYRKEKTGVDLSAPTLPLELELQPKEYVKKSEEDMLLEAENELLPSLTKRKNAESEKLEKARNDYSEKSADAVMDQSNELDLLYREGANALENHRDDMIFQGLVNSTINEKGASDIKRQTNVERLKIEEKYDDKLLKIKNDLTLAEREYANAVKEYDLEYAADLQEKLNKLKLNEEKRMEEINAYNAKLAERQEKYNSERLEILSNLRLERQKALFEEMKREQAEEAELGVSPEKAEEYARRKNMAISFYNNFTKEEAYVLLADASEKLKSLLGEDEFLRLLQWNNQR